MKRPIDQEGGNRRAVMWKDDKYARGWDVTEVSRALHRYAGRQMLSCIPKLSAVDKRYFAEINLWQGQGAMRFNVAMGTGPDPVDAALTGYERALPGDPMWRVFRLELEAERLRRALAVARDQERRLDRLLDTVADLLAKLSPETPAEAVARLAASNTEDDDL